MLLMQLFEVWEGNLPSGRKFSLYNKDYLLSKVFYAIFTAVKNGFKNFSILK